ncbi:MAG: sugar-binding protein [Fuerstiella sp.]
MPRLLCEPSVRNLFLALSLICFSGCADGDPDSGGSGDGGTSADGDGKKPSVAYVTNGIASFWVIADKGAMDGGREFNADVTVQMPANGVEDQKRMCQDLLAQGIDGIAISPIDPDNQGDLLAEIAQHSKLITHDSDAPDSDRLCYIGMDNYTAGRLCGALVKEAMPEGGSVMIFVGRLGQANARLRRQGVIDELMDRSHDPTRYDEPSAGEINGDKYTVLDTRTDGFDFGKAKAQAQDAIAKYENLGCMVGLFAYNPPLMLDAVREANKLGDIKIVAFDEEDATLQGIVDGEIHGTVVQNPYKYGFESVRVLAALARGDESVIPEGGFLDIPARQIRKDNVKEFRAELQRLTATDTPAPADGADATPEPAAGETSTPAGDTPAGDK